MKKQYIYIAETSDDEDELTCKWKSMNFFNKLVNKLLSPIKKELQTQLNRLNESIETLKKDNITLRNQIEDLKKQLTPISESLKEQKDICNQLKAAQNTKKASIDVEYKVSIDALYSLNKLFCQNVPIFGRARKLNCLQKLLKYLYRPTDELKEELKNYVTEDERARTIYNAIEKFNAENREKIISYLIDQQVKWEDCVIFPEDTIFNPDTMEAFNDVDIDKDKPVYVVVLGLSFPNSNSEVQRPQVVINKD